VWLHATDPADSDTGCNNIVLLDTQIEGSYYHGVFLGQHTRKCRIVASKFHGTLPSPQPYNHLVFYDADTNMVIGCNFTNGGADQISIEAGAKGNIIVGNIIDGAAEWGIDIVSGDNNIIEGNSFGELGKNASGSVRVQAGGGNIYGSSNKSNDDTVIGSITNLGALEGWGREERKTTESGQQVLLDLTSNPATAAAADAPGLGFKHKNSAGGIFQGALITAPLQDPTNGSEDVDVKIVAKGGGTLAELARFKGATRHLLVQGGLGVGNSAAGTTLGSVVKKIEVFDENGNSLGFIPVYDSIT